MLYFVYDFQGNLLTIKYLWGALPEEDCFICLHQFWCTKFARREDVKNFIAKNLHNFQHLNITFSCNVMDSWIGQHAEIRDKYIKKCLDVLYSKATPLISTFLDKMYNKMVTTHKTVEFFHIVQLIMSTKGG